MTHTEIVRKLIGPIEPVGCSTTDAKRFQNLQDLEHLLQNLLSDVIDMRKNAISNEASVKAAGAKAVWICGNIYEQLED